MIYLALFIFCLITSLRDVLSEILFAKGSSGASPAFSLFVYCLVTQFACLIYLIWKGNVKATLNLIIPQAKEERNEFWMLNATTFGAFLTYFLAIESPLGAGLNSAIDYILSPLFTGILAFLLIKEKLDKKFWILSIFSIFAVAIFYAPRTHLQTSFSNLEFGLISCIASAFLSALYRIYYKKLLANGNDKIPILFSRLILSTLILGIYVIIKSEVVSLSIFVSLLCIGFIGFFMPLILTLFIVQRVTLSHFSLILYLVPILTYILSSFFGKTVIFKTDFIAVCILVGAIGINEWVLPKAKAIKL